MRRNLQQSPCLPGLAKATLWLGSRPTSECFLSSDLSKLSLQTRRVRHETGESVTPDYNMPEGSGAERPPSLGPYGQAEGRGHGNEAPPPSPNPERFLPALRTGFQAENR